jgi:anthranilate/para-aminobenzoate synthase component I
VQESLPIPRPEKEYDETLNKAQAIFRAIQVAEEGLR